MTETRQRIWYLPAAQGLTQAPLTPTEESIMIRFGITEIESGTLH